MLYTEKEKNEIERVRKVFEKHIRQMTAYDLVWSDKVGYVWLAISIDPVYIDTGNWIESRCGLCNECLNDIALDVFGMTGNDHDFEDADPLELAEIQAALETLYRPTAGICVPLRRTVKQEKITHPPKCQELKSASWHFFLWLFCEFD